MAKENIQHKLNASVEVISYSPKSAIFQLNQKQRSRRKYTMRVPISFASPQDKSLLEEIVNSIEGKKDVRFKGIYEELPNSLMAYLAAVGNIITLIQPNPRKTLSILKRYKYKGNIVIGSRKKTYYKIEAKYTPLMDIFRIEKSQSF